MELRHDLSWEYAAGTCRRTIFLNRACCIALLFGNKDPEAVVDLRHIPFFGHCGKEINLTFERNLVGLGVVLLLSCIINILALAINPDGIEHRIAAETAGYDEFA